MKRILTIFSIAIFSLQASVQSVRLNSLDDLFAGAHSTIKNSIYSSWKSSSQFPFPDAERLKLLVESSKQLLRYSEVTE